MRTRISGATTAAAVMTALALSEVSGRQLCLRVSTGVASDGELRPPQEVPTGWEATLRELRRRGTASTCRSFAAAPPVREPGPTAPSEHHRPDDGAMGDGGDGGDGGGISADSGRTGGGWLVVSAVHSGARSCRVRLPRFTCDKSTG